MHLYCTQKLYKAFGFPKDHLAPPTSLNRLFGWHAHIVSIARTKTVVAINDQTFFAVTMLGIKKERLKNFENEFYLVLSSLLKSEGFEDSHVDALFGGHIAFGKAYDRQVLGIINQVVQYIHYYVEDGGGWEEINVMEINRSINRTPWLAGTRNVKFPIDQMTNALLKTTPCDS